MERAGFIEPEGRKILFIDFSQLVDKKDVLEVIASAQPLIAKQDEKSLLTLTDVTGTVADGETTSALWQFLRHNKPYVLAGAVVGVESEEQETLYSLLTHQARRELPMFDAIEEAKEWLVNIRTTPPMIGG